MARLGKETIRVSDRNNKDVFMQVEFVINVSADGYFTTTLSEQDVRTIEDFGIRLYNNGRRGARKGFFSKQTKSELLQEIKELLQKCISKTIIKEEIVIRYAFCTVASFGFTMDGKIVPNLAWTRDGELNHDLHWQQGTYTTYSSNPAPVGVQMYVKPYYKRTFRYLDGKEVTEYDRFTAFGSDVAKEEQYYLSWLENICSTKPPERGGEVHEMEYTEDRAKFFVDMFKAICKMAHTIANFNQPEQLTKLIESGKYLMQ